MTFSISFMILPILCLTKLDYWVSSYNAETFNLVCWKQAVQGMTTICYKVLLCTKAKSWERMILASKEDNSYCCYEGLFLFLSYLFLSFFHVKVSNALLKTWTYIFVWVGSDYANMIQSILLFTVLSSFICSLTHDINFSRWFFFASVSSVTKQT